MHKEPEWSVILRATSNILSSVKHKETKMFFEILLQSLEQDVLEDLDCLIDTELKDRHYAQMD